MIWCSVSTFQQAGQVCNGEWRQASPRLILRVLLNDNPDILISTPSRLLSLLQAKTVNLDHLAFLAIDEADLLMSYGHKEDLEKIMDKAAGYVPRHGVQGCLVSATLSDDVEGVKGLVLRNPVSVQQNTRSTETNAQGNPNPF